MVAELSATGNGLPLFDGKSWEDHVSSWFDIAEAVESAQWMRGAIVASLDTKYGSGAVEKFAGEVMLTARMLRLYRQVHDFYQNGNRFPNLSWKHHLVAMHATDAATALNLAEAEGLSAANLARRLKVRVAATGDELPLLALPAANHGDTDGDEWFTPSEYIESARAVLGDIDLDPATCASAQEIVSAKKFYTKDDDGLSKRWFGNVWLNPPYSYPLVEQFTSHAIQQYDKGNVKAAIILTNNCTDAAWFQSLVELFPVCLTRGRVPFWRPDQKSFATRQGQAFFYAGKNAARFIEEFSQYGTVLIKA